MRKFRVKMTAVLLACAVMTGISINTSASSFFSKENDTYTDIVEKLLSGLVPEQGLTIKDRTYKYEDVLAFLEEVRWAPDYCVHKNHHCVLAELPEEEVQAVVSFLRVLMDCPVTYTDPKIIMDVQEHLMQEGFDCEMADGILGPLTFAALNEYQKKHDLDVINAVTDELLSCMGLEYEQETEQIILKD